jgi:parallel beta helix pectate lyase-like protein
MGVTMRPLTLSLALMATILAAAPPAAEATNIPGGNLVTQTWTPAGSPYVVMGDATVQAGRTLTIQAGTTVTFASTDGVSGGLDTTKVELTIQGTLNVNGNGGSPVIFRAQTGTTSGIWYGIVLGAGATASFSDFEVRNAIVGLETAASGAVQVLRGNFTVSGTGIKTSAGALRVRDSLLSANGQAIHSLGGSPLFEAVTVFNNSDGIRIAGSSAATILNSVVRGSAGSGIFLFPTSATTNYVTHSTIHANVDYGILTSSAVAGAQYVIRNCIVTNSQNGVHKFPGDPGTMSLTYSDVWNNNSNYSGFVPGAGTISVNPLYVGAPTDLHLFAGSSAVDAAQELGVTSDRDGTPRPLDGDEFGGAQPDMGAYEVVPASYDLIFLDNFENGP